MYYGLILFSILEIVNNIIKYIQTLKISTQMMKYEINIVKSLKGTIFITFIATVICLLLHKNKIKKDNKFIDSFVKNILIYFGIMFTIGLFIMYNY